MVLPIRYDSEQRSSLKCAWKQQALNKCWAYYYCYRSEVLSQRPFFPQETLGSIWRGRLLASSRWGWGCCSTPYRCPGRPAGATRP